MPPGEQSRVLPLQELTGGRAAVAPGEGVGEGSLAQPCSCPAGSWSQEIDHAQQAGKARTGWRESPECSRFLAFCHGCRGGEMGTTGQRVALVNNNRCPQAPTRDS